MGSALPPAQPMDTSNGYYSNGNGTGGSGSGPGVNLPPPRSGGSISHGNVIAEIQRVMASEAGAETHRGHGVGLNVAGPGGKALKSNIPRLSRLDASTIKNGHLLL